MEKKQNPHNVNTANDSTMLIKLAGRILSQLREHDAKFEMQEELILELRKIQLTQSAPKSFEPIRGIHGLADFLGVSPVTAQKIKNSGKIPYAQFERLILFDPQRVLDALEANGKSKK